MLLEQLCENVALEPVEKNSEWKITRLCDFVYF